MAMLVCIAALGGCAHIPAGCDRWFCRDAVYFVGAREHIDLVEPMPQQGISSVEIAPFEQVDVVERRAGLIKFKRRIGWHAPVIAWASAEVFVRYSDFVPQQRWPEPERVDFCTPGEGCYRLDIATDGRFALARVGGGDRALCALRPDIQPSTGECAIVGRLRLAHGYIMLDHEDGYREFFARDASGHWCWLTGRRLYGSCLPSIDGTNAPASPNQGH
ncbi:MAG: hypothetical protein E6Q88_05550 [Lysobacteraceae bacterium]|nr:MAG: hypothetical protein E6Q88_05550 [Xanthomonadaceae bacterium]